MLAIERPTVVKARPASTRQKRQYAPLELGLKTLLHFVGQVDLHLAKEVAKQQRGPRVTFEQRVEAVSAREQRREQEVAMLDL